MIILQNGYLSTFIINNKYCKKIKINYILNEKKKHIYELRLFNR